MTHHWHTGIESFIFVTISAIIGLNLVRWLAAHMARLTGPLGTFGTALGGTVTFAGAA